MKGQGEQGEQEWWVEQGGATRETRARRARRSRSKKSNKSKEMKVLVKEQEDQGDQREQGMQGEWRREQGVQRERGEQKTQNWELRSIYRLSSKALFRSAPLIDNQPDTWKLGLPLGMKISQENVATRGTCFHVEVSTNIERETNRKQLGGLGLDKIFTINGLPSPGPKNGCKIPDFAAGRESPAGWSQPGSPN